MSGRRPLFRSPKFADGMTSEAIEVSGVKVFISAIGRGNGVARRFESVLLVPPSDISILKPGKRTAINFFQRNLSTILPPYSLRNRLTDFRRAFWPTVCGTHHLLATLIAAGAADRPKRRGRAWRREVWRSSTLS